ncbi:MAG: glycosyltransferase [Nitrospirae bacterium]|nr:glycosyltransferase [Nitrospirota bacterium]
MALKEKISEHSTLCIFGFGLGYHIEALMKVTDCEILVFEPDIDVLKIALTHRDLGKVLGRIKIISNYDIPLIKGSFRILKHNPSVRLQQRYYEIVEDYLRTRRVLQTGLRIAVVGPIYGGSLPIAEYTVKALKALGHRVYYIDNSVYHEAFLFIDNVTRRSDLQDELRRQFVEFASTSVLARCEEHKPDLLIALAQAPLTQKSLEILRAGGLKTAFWFVENYRHLDYWRYIFPHYDYLFVIQKGEFITHIKETLRKPVHYLPLAASPDVHRPLELTEDEIKEYGSDVSFVGAGYKNRREFFTGLIDYDLKIWGNEWDLNSPLGRVIQREGRRVSTEDIVKIFNASKININLHSSAVHSGVDPFGDFINPRTFEIAASRAFQLVDTRESLSEFFDIGKEIETFKSLNELRKKIDYYLSHPEERVEIAEAGYRRVLKEHTYEIRLEEMIDFIMRHDFNLPAWTEKEIFVDEIMESNGYNNELKEFFKQLKDKGRVTFEEIIEHIRDSEGDLSEAEKIFLFMNEVKNQYARP